MMFLLEGVHLVLQTNEIALLTVGQRLAAIHTLARSTVGTVMQAARARLKRSTTRTKLLKIRTRVGF